MPEWPEPEERDRLEQERDREGRDEHDCGGLPPQRPEHGALHRQGERQDDREAERDPDADRPVAIRGVRERECAGHDQLPVGEVHEPHHAEDQPDADRHEREDRAEADRVDLDLQVEGVAHEVGEAARKHHERYAATMRSVSAASSGVRVRRSSPFASTCVRSASATVRWARCSTSSTPIPRSAMTRSVENTRSTIVGASPSDGSSSRRIDGFATSARAIASCCCWPPESAPAWRLRNSLDDREQLDDGGDVLLDAVRSAACGEPEPQVLLHRELREEPAPFGDERDAGSRDRLRRAAAQRAVAQRDVASTRGDQPMIACSVVDFPAPFGPMSPTISPGATLNETPRTAATPP